MRTIKIIPLLLAFVITLTQAQTEVKTSDQSRSIEINNDNGDLSISFINGVITEFVVNDTPIAPERYNEYQDIIDDFTEEDNVQTTSPTPPTTPRNHSNESDALQTALAEFLMNEGYITTFKKYKIHLKRNFLKVNGKKISDEIHDACLEIFNEIYGHKLNSKSQVKFLKSKGNSSSSISIVE